MRILIVVPRFISKPGDYYEFPLGLCSIASALKAQGHEVHGLNLNHRGAMVEEEISRVLQKGDYDLLATGGLSPHYEIIVRILEAARKTQPGLKTVVGGGLVSSDPEWACENLAVTAGVIGEGERTVVELACALQSGAELSTIAGLVFRRDDRVVRTAPRPFIADLESLPDPDYGLFEVEDYLAGQKPNDNYYLYPFDRPRLLPVISSRSCPYQCTFCFHPLGDVYRSEAPAAVLARIARWRDAYGLNMVSLLDELFLLDPGRVDAFCEGLARLNLKWIAQMRVDCVDARTLRRLKEAGLICVSYGVESAAPAVLKSMRKRITLPQIENALAFTRREKIGIQGNLLFGDPAETVETARQSLAWARDHAEYGLNLNFVVPYPGSEIHRQAVSRGVIADKTAYVEAGCPAVNLTRLDTPELLWLRSEIMAVQSLARKPAVDPAVEILQAGEDPLYQFSLTCPHCGARNVYSRFKVSGVRHARIACRVCHQRQDYVTVLFPHIRRPLSLMIAQAKACAAQAVPLAVAPSLVNVTFREYFAFLDLAPERLNIRMVLDPRPELNGQLQADRIPILPPTTETMQKTQGLTFLVLPCPGHEPLARMLRDDFHITPERIIRLNGENEKTDESVNVKM